MPPGPPYFDWAEYRTFLRGPGVAWRNTHRVVSTPDPATLTFWIAGTPDRARYFDFEVIQHLPAGAMVALQVPPALAAKLHQRQPWLGDGAGLWPKRPRIAIRGVELAAGTYAKAEFTVTVQPGSPRLETGHSLAIRQLWRGEEVGRITWFFESPT
jgi:serine protease